MANEKYNFEGDSSSLVKALANVEKATEKVRARWAAMLTSGQEVTNITARLGKEFITLTGQVKGVTDSGKEYAATIQQLAAKSSMLLGKMQVVNVAMRDQASALERIAKASKTYVQSGKASLDIMGNLAGSSRDTAKATSTLSNALAGEATAATRSTAALRGVTSALVGYNAAASSATASARAFSNAAAIRALTSGGRPNVTGGLITNTATETSQSIYSRARSGVEDEAAQRGLNNIRLRAQAILATNNAQSQYNVLAERAVRNSQEMLLSWRGIARIAAVQLLHKGITLLIQEINQGVDAAKRLQINIAEIQTIDFSGSSLINWFNALKNVSDQWGLDIFDQAEAAYESLSNQVIKSSSDFNVFGNVISEFAVVTKSTASDAVDLLSGAINAFNRDITDARTLATEFFKIIDLGRVRAREMKDAGDLFILANQLGIAIEDLGGAITTLTRQGTSFQQVSTELSVIMLKLIQPTKEMKKFFSELGVSSGEAAIATYGFAGFLRLLEERTKGSTSELGKLFSRINSIRGAVGLQGSALQDMERDISEIKNATEDYNRASKLVMETPGKQFQLALTRIVNQFAEMGNTAITNLSLMTNGFKDIQNVVINLAKVGVPLLISALVALGSVLTITLLSNPFGLLAAWIGYLVGNMVVVKILAKDFVQTLDEGVGKWRNTVAEGFQAEQKTLNDLVDRTDEYYKSITQKALEASAKQLGAWNKLQDARIESSATALKSLQRHLDALSDYNREILSKLNRDYDDFKKNIEDSVKEGINLVRDAEQAILKFKLRLAERSDDNQAIAKLLADRAAEIRKRIIAKPQSREEIEQNRKYYEELQTLQERQSELTIKLADKEVKTAQEKYDDQIQQAEKYEAERKRLVERVRKEELQRERKGLPLVTPQIRQALEDAKKANETGQEIRNNAEKELEAAKATANARINQLNTEKEINAILAERKKQEEAFQKTMEAAAAKARAQAFLEEDRQQRIKDAQAAISKFKLTELRKEDLEGLALAKDELFGKGKQSGAFSTILENAQEALKADPQNIRLQQLVVELQEQATAVRDFISAQEKVLTEQKRQQEIEKQRAIIEQKQNALLDQYKELGAQFEEVGAKLQTVIQLIPGKEEFGRMGDPNKSPLYNENFINLLKPITDMVAGAGEDVGYLYTGQDKARAQANFVEALQKNAKTLLDGSGNQVEAAKAISEALGKLNLEQTTGGVDRTFDKVVETFKSLKQITDAITKTQLSPAQLIEQRDKIKKALEDMSQAIGALPTPAAKTVASIDELARAATEAATALRGLIAQGPGLGPVPARAFGGMMPFGTDTVPAMLSPGEFVVNAAAAKQFYSQLVAMNSSVRPRRYAEGGSVDVGGININVHAAANHDPQTVARVVAAEINRGIRQGTIRLRR